MKNIKCFFLLAGLYTAVISCKKSDEPVPEPVTEKVVRHKDSISFFIGDKQYTFNTMSKFGAGNRGVNIKVSDSKDNPGKLMVSRGNLYGFGEKDSTMYSAFYGISSSDGYQSVEISFSKKYRDDQLSGGNNFRKPKDYFELLKIGALPFSIDLNRESTLEGVSVDFYEFGVGNLGSDLSGLSIFDKTNLTRDIQNNSDFQITKVEKYKDNYYLIEAKFELNLFDNQERLFRATDGFMSILVDMRGYFNYN